MSTDDTPVNPYASPEAFDDHPANVDSEVEALRKKLLSHEASIQSMGVLFFIGAVINILLGLVWAGLGVVALVGGEGSGELLFMLGLGVVVLGLGAVQFWVARGLRRLDKRVRIPAAILSGLSLIWIPIGTLIGGYFLYLLLSDKGAQVMSPQYKEIIAATPHIKYKTSIVVWIFLGLLIFVIAMAAIAAIVGIAA